MSGGGSYQSTSLSSSRSKSLDSSEGLSYSSTFSSPETETKLSSGTVGSSSSRSKSSDSSHKNSELPFKTLGRIESSTGFGEGPLDVINAIDVAQQEELLSFIAEGEEIFLNVSIHGIKVTSAVSKAVKHRIPLHMIERLVTFDDGICGHVMLAVKVVEPNICVLLVYQCPNVEASLKITQSFSHVLSKVLSSTPNKDICLELQDERSI